MSAPIIWRDVAAPDLSTSLGALRLGNDAMNSGFNALKSGVGAWDDARHENAAQQLARNSMQFGSQADLMKAQQDPNSALYKGIDMNLVPASALNSIGTRASNLLTQATNQQSYDQNGALNPIKVQGAKLAQEQAQYSFDRKKENDTVDDDSTNLADKWLKAGANSHDDLVRMHAADPEEDVDTKNAALTKALKQLGIYQGGAAPAAAGANGAAAAATGAPSAIAAAAGDGNGVAIDDLATALPGYKARTRALESLGSGGDNAVSPTGYKGRYQFGPAEWAKYGGGGNIFDGDAQEKAMDAYTADHYNQLKSALGRAPTMGELYLAHQQGVGGATKLLQNPNAKAGDLVGADHVSKNGGDPNGTAAEFAQKWLTRFGETPGLKSRLTGQDANAAAMAKELADRNNQELAGGINSQFSDTQKDDPKFEMNDAVKQLQSGNFGNVGKEEIIKKLNELHTKSIDTGTGKKPVTLKTAAAILNSSYAPNDGFSVMHPFRTWDNLGAPGLIPLDGGQKEDQILQAAGRGQTDQLLADNRARAADGAALTAALAEREKARADYEKTRSDALVRPTVAGSLQGKAQTLYATMAKVDQLLQGHANAKAVGPNTQVVAPQYATQQEAEAAAKAKAEKAAAADASEASAKRASYGWPKML